MTATNVSILSSNATRWGIRNWTITFFFFPHSLRSRYNRILVRHSIRSELHGIFHGRSNRGAKCAACWLPGEGISSCHIQVNAIKTVRILLLHFRPPMFLRDEKKKSISLSFLGICIHDFCLVNDRCRGEMKEDKVVLFFTQCNYVKIFSNHNIFWKSEVIFNFFNGMLYLF